MELSKYRADFHWDPGSPEGLQRFWDPGSLDSFKSMEFTSSSESIFCTCEDGMVSGQPKPPWLMCDAEFVSYETLFGRLPEFDVENAEWTEASVQFWYEDAYRYIKQRKCGGVGKLAWLKWISLVLRYSSDNAVSGVIFQIYATNIISFSSDAMTVGNLLLKQPWLPLVLLNTIIVMRLMPWPSFCYHHIAAYYKVLCHPLTLMVGQQLNGWSGEQIRKHQFGCVALHVIDVLISGVDEIYIQSSRGVVVIFLCLIWVLVVYGQRCSMSSEAAMMGNKFTKSLTIGNPIQGHYMLMLEISGSPYSFPAITVADRLYGLFSLSEYMNSQMANAAKAVTGDWKMVQKGPDRLVLTVSTTEAMQCLKSVLFIWVISSMGVVMLNSCMLTAYLVPCIALYFVQISVLGQNTKQSAMEYVPCLLFAAAIAEIVDTVGRQEIGRANIEQTLSQLLTEMYSLEEKTGMMLIAVTTRTVNVDSAFLLNSPDVVLQGSLSVLQWSLDPHSQMVLERLLRDAIVVGPNPTVYELPIALICLQLKHIHARCSGRIQPLEKYALVIPENAGGFTSIHKVLYGSYIRVLDIPVESSAMESCDQGDPKPPWCTYVINDQGVLTCLEKMKIVLNRPNSNDWNDWKSFTGLEETESFIYGDGTLILQEKQTVAVVSKTVQPKVLLASTDKKELAVSSHVACKLRLPATSSMHPMSIPLKLSCGATQFCSVVVLLGSALQYGWLHCQSRLWVGADNALQSSLTSGHQSPELLHLLGIPDSAWQNDRMGFVDGSLQSDTAEHIRELVFLKLHQHIQSYMTSQADHKLAYLLNIPVQSAVICFHGASCVAVEQGGGKQHGVITSSLICLLEDKQHSMEGEMSGIRY